MSMLGRGEEQEGQMGVRERVGLVHRLGFWHGVWCAGGGDDGFQFKAIDGREHRPSPESVSLAASPDEAVRERAVQIESIRPRFVPAQEKCAGTELAFDVLPCIADSCTDFGSDVCLS